jgi:lambda repressor-like predicted transcriptional regulator
MKLSPRLLERITRPKLVEFLDLPQSIKIPKQELVARLSHTIDSDPSEQERLLDFCAVELAVEPKELEVILGCTTSERRRWSKEGKLPAVGVRRSKISRGVSYEIYERRAVLAITPEEVRAWRAEHEEVVKSNRRAGAAEGLEARRETLREKKEMREAEGNWRGTLDELRRQGQELLAATLELCYWTVWASRWAKTNELAARGSNGRDLEHERLRDSWYGRKNKAVEHLSRAPFARLSFYRPARPDKLELRLCRFHLDDYRGGMSGEHGFGRWSEPYENVREFYNFNRDDVDSCGDCEVHVLEGYYSLYFLEVRAPEPYDAHFSFHTPYPVGRHFLPDPSALPVVEHVEDESHFSGPGEFAWGEQRPAFRFGRSLRGIEEKVFDEETVMEKFDLALKAFLDLLAHQTQGSSRR